MPASCTLHELLKRYRGRPIPNCPGRYVLAGRLTQVPPKKLVGEGCREERFEETAAKDAVVVTFIEDWGLISFHRADGSWCHTANDSSGFKRKLIALGLKSWVS